MALLLGTSDDDPFVAVGRSKVRADGRRVGTCWARSKKDWKSVCLLWKASGDLN